MQIVTWFIRVEFFIQIFMVSTWGWRLGEEIHWLPDLEWSARNNWQNNELPGENNRIVFPVELEHSVGLPLNGQFQFSGLDLSRDGSLLLPKDGSIKLSDSRDKKFKDKISRWKRSGPFYWLDPNNWNNTNKAMPHLERIPCSTDTIVLPDNYHAVTIKLPNEDVTVKKIKIGSEFVGNTDWQMTMEGREFRKSRQSVKFSGLQYCAAEECLCRHNSDNIDLLIAEICTIQSPRCSERETGCELPLKVEGHCCDYCGGRLSIDNKVSLLELEELSNEALNNYKDTVSWHARMTWDENLEVLITENDEYTGIKSQEALDILTGALTARGIIVMSKISTGSPLTGTIFTRSLIPILGVLLIIIILFLAALPYFGYTYNQLFVVLSETCLSVREGAQPSQNPATETGTFGFARFQNVADGDIQLARTAFEEEEEEEEGDDGSGDDREGNGGAGHRGKRFENPLYRSKKEGTLKEDTKLDEEVIDVNSTLRFTDLQTRLSSNETDVDSE